MLRTTVPALVFFCFFASTYAADSFPKVDADLAEYDAAIQKMKDDFALVPADPTSQEWIAKKLQHMVDTDQYMRKFSTVVHDHQYSPDEQAYFHAQFLEPRWLALDKQNTAELKSLLQTHSWFTISQFGKKADSNAWLLVQHADADPAFQAEILAKLEQLYNIGETRPANYAYLYDRVADSSGDPSKRRPQRYGTQGTCVAPGKWEPHTIEDPDYVDARRATVGLPPLNEYIAGFQSICK